MSVKIIVNGEECWRLDRNLYFSYSEYSNEKVRRIREDLKEGLDRENGLLIATFYCSRRAFRRGEPDLDNALLYNLGITKAFDAFVLEKKIGDEFNNVIYDYQIIPQFSTSEMINNEYDLDTQNIEFTDESTDVSFYYNLFRNWLSRQDRSAIENYYKLFLDNRLEVVIEYQGKTQFKEFPFIKHAVDGIVSAMQINRNANERVDPICPDLCILNGEDAISARGRWNPKDDLINKIVVIRGTSSIGSNYLRIRIRRSL